jgi:hypothetical protein
VIAASRFLVESTDHENWLEARRGGVTATEVAKAATASGFRAAVEERLNPTTIDDNPFMQFGRDPKMISDLLDVAKNLLKETAHAFVH